MGILSILFGKKSPPTEPSLHTQAEALTMQESPEHKQQRQQAFAEAFGLHASMLGIFSQKEISDMIDFIVTSYGGPENMHSWSSQIFDNYFANKEWRWPLFDEMRAILKVENIDEGIENNTGETSDISIFPLLCMKLSVAQKKDVLSKLDIPFDKKAKNTELLGILLKATTPEAIQANNPEITELFTQYRHIRRRGLFEFFRNHVIAYAQNIEKVKRIESSGMQYKIEFMDATDETIARKMSTKFPVPPFFPGNIAIIKPILDMD